MGNHHAASDDDQYLDIHALHKLVEEQSRLPRGSAEWTALETREAALTRKIWDWARENDEDRSR